MAKKRILLVSQHFWPESFRSTDLAMYFVENGHEVDVLCGIPNYPKGRFFDGYGIFKNHSQTYKGININRALEIARGDSSNFRIFLNYVSFPLFSILHIPRLLLKRYDKIFMFQTSPVFMTIAGIILGRIKGVETTMYVLDLWPENLYSVLDLNNAFLKRLIAYISHWHYRHVDKLIVLSSSMRNQLLQISGISPNRIAIIPQAAEKLYEKNLNDKELENKFSKGFNLVFTGSITPAQSFNTMIEAANIIKSKGIEDINWIIVGDGMSKSWLEDKVKKSGLQDCFYFEGLKPVEDIPKYTNIADGLIGCLVKSNLLEATIPAKVMSYIASAKPLILAMDGEAQDLINNIIRGGYAGPTEDAKVLAENIIKLYNLPKKERIAISKRLSMYHKKNFDRNLLLNKLNQFIFD